jgi:hypothetical protein
MTTHVDVEASTAVRIPTRVCLLCHSLTRAGQFVLAGIRSCTFLVFSINFYVVVGTDSFHGYSQSFLSPTHETRSGIKLYQAANKVYISICCPTSCSPYCCRTSPLIAFVFHTECVQTLQTFSEIPIRALWSLVRCIQPLYANFENVGTLQQVRSVTASISSADPALFRTWEQLGQVKHVELDGQRSASRTVSQPNHQSMANQPNKIRKVGNNQGCLEISLAFRLVQKLPPEIQCITLDFAGPSLGLSLLTVLLDTLPLLEIKRTLALHQRQIQLNYSKKMFLSYVTIRGQSYISDISNEQRHGMHEVLCITHPEYAILSLDDLGIRGICFVAEESGSKPTGAPWYQHEKLNQNPDDTILVTQNVRRLNE